MAAPAPPPAAGGPPPCRTPLAGVVETALRASFHAALRAHMRAAEGAVDEGAAATTGVEDDGALPVLITWRQAQFDAFDFFALVQSWGGADKVTLAVQWNACGRELGLEPSTDFGNAMRAIYEGRQGHTTDGTRRRVCVRAAATRPHALFSLPFLSPSCRALTLALGPFRVAPRATTAHHT
jgi:hypothetical protein